MWVLFLSGLSLYPQEQYVADSQGNWSAYSKIIAGNIYAVPTNNYSSKPYFIKNNSYMIYIGNRAVDSGYKLSGKWGVDESILLKNGNVLMNEYELPETNQKIYTVYGDKSFVSQTDDIWCVFWDSEKNVIDKVKLNTASDRKITGIGVIPTEPISNATVITFVDEDDSPIDLCTGCYIVYGD